MKRSSEREEAGEHRQWGERSRRSTRARSVARPLPTGPSFLHRRSAVVIPGERPRREPQAPVWQEAIGGLRLVKEKATSGTRSCWYGLASFTSYRSCSGMVFSCKGFSKAIILSRTSLANTGWPPSSIGSSERFSPSARNWTQATDQDVVDWLCFLDTQGAGTTMVHTPACGEIGSKASDSRSRTHGCAK